MTDRMDESLRKRWTTALTCGKFRQVAGKLRSGRDEFSALGVLCNLWDPTRWTQARGAQVGSMPIAYREPFKTRKPKLSLFTVSESTRKALGLLTIHLCVIQAMEERGRKSFAQIADYIRDNV